MNLNATNYTKLFSPRHLRWRIATALRLLREGGPRKLFGALYARWGVPIIARFQRPQLERRLAEIVAAAEPDKRHFVIVSTVDFNFPFAQRPQHLARALARLGHLCIYLTPRTGHDRFGPLETIEPNLVVTDQLDLLRKKLRDPAVMLLSTDNRIDRAVLSDFRAWTPYVVYDYIDHIDPAISMCPVPAGHIEAHSAMLEDESILVVASAQVLIEEVAAKRPSGRNMVLATNGVDTGHFKVTRSREGVTGPLAQLIGTKRPIIGYFGVLATWFDYDLLAAGARLRPGMDFVLIGPDYDGSAATWREKVGAACPPNLHFLPPIPYPQLPRHAVWFDVALVPFVVNAITLATSPLKLFEYMAMGTPVVSTPLPECRKQPSVLIASNSEEFVARIDEALDLGRSPEHRAQLLREADESAWSSKARAIIDATTALTPAVLPRGA